MTLIGLTLATVLIGAIFWRSIAASSSGGTQASNSPDNVVSSGHDTNQVTSGPQVQQPAEILSISPEKDGFACPTAEVGVGFSLKGAMLKDGEMDAAAFSMMLDGEDITAEIKIQGTMDFPQSQATLSYQPSLPLSLGRHEANVSFPDSKTGEVQTYTWGFNVRERPCP